MKNLFFLAFAAFALAACSDDKPDPEVLPPVTETAEVVDFEAADLGSEGFMWGKSRATEKDDPVLKDDLGRPIPSNIFFEVLYSEKQAQVISYYTDYGHNVPPMDIWNGFVISNLTDRKTDTFKNDKSVYAEGGADGSKQFAVGYYGAMTPRNGGIPTIKFRKTVNLKSLQIANATYPYLYFKKNGTTKAHKFNVIITGYKTRTPTGSVTVPMIVDNAMTEGWSTVDLKDLGLVNKIDMKVDCPDEMAPTYFCIDNLKYE